MDKTSWTYSGIRHGWPGDMQTWKENEFPALNDQGVGKNVSCCDIYVNVYPPCRVPPGGHHTTSCLSISEHGPPANCLNLPNSLSNMKIYLSRWISGRRVPWRAEGGWAAGIQPRHNCMVARLITRTDVKTPRKGANTAPMGFVIPDHVIGLWLARGRI